MIQSNALSGVWINPPSCPSVAWKASPVRRCRWILVRELESGFLISVNDVIKRRVEKLRGRERKLGYRRVHADLHISTHATAEPFFNSVLVDEWWIRPKNLIQG